MPEATTSPQPEDCSLPPVCAVQHNPGGQPAHGLPGAAQYRRRIDTDGQSSPSPADPAADWWTMDDIAAFLSSRGPRSIQVASVRRYRGRSRERGGLPSEDHKFGRTPVWRPQTIIDWHEHERRGQGWRSSQSGDGGDGDG
jgi:hypothetical protein